jgi:hypothetical protein
MKAKREQAYGDLLIIKLFASNYARDLIHNSDRYYTKSQQKK